MLEVLWSLLKNRWVQLLLVIGVALVTIKIEQARAAHLKQELAMNEEKLAVAQAAIDAAEATNDTDEHTIDDLKKQISEMVEQRRLDDLKVAEAGAARDAAMKVAQHNADELRKEINAAWNSSPDCQKLRDTHVGAACPALVGKLRQLSAHGAHTNPDS